MKGYPLPPHWEKCRQDYILHVTQKIIMQMKYKQESQNLNASSEFNFRD